MLGFWDEIGFDHKYVEFASSIRFELVKDIGLDKVAFWRKDNMNVYWVKLIFDDIEYIPPFCVNSKGDLGCRYSDFKIHLKKVLFNEKQDKLNEMCKN